MFVAESDTIRKNRHDNITISVFQQYWFLASCLSLLSESFATFRAITGGIIGGKTLGYIPMVIFKKILSIFQEYFGNKDVDYLLSKDIFKLKKLVVQVEFWAITGGIIGGKTLGYIPMVISSYL